jgi:hypothetical protein
MSCIVVSTEVFGCYPPVDPLNQRLGDFILFDQEVGLGGSEWVRALGDTMTLSQSDYWIESLSSTMILLDQAIGVKDLFETLIDPVTFSHENTISGGRMTLHPPDVTATFTSTTSKGMAVYVDGANTVDLGQADVESTALVIGLAEEDVSAGGTGNYLTEGQVEQSDWTAVTGSATLVTGATYYLSTTVAGGLTITPPSTDGDIVVRVGTALSTTEIDIEIAQPVLL